MDLPHTHNGRAIASPLMTIHVHHMRPANIPSAIKLILLFALRYRNQLQQHERHVD